ncbi:hypothetical protein [Arthrobacter sp. M4]|uniref:hypothetical protein n=1 Tax=Arthrobacter sp. M4 TaxID=218160 RepID=UPI001CDC97B8|nr:hypothetical protein [Arthrobacter sp. M4]MCA4133786.1 hypothetical protein [Arthrobacter sp. M4]
MSADSPGELTGQISINELLIAMGEAPVEHVVIPDSLDDFSNPATVAPTLPGL